MDDETKAALLNGAQAILDDVRERLRPANAQKNDFSVYDAVNTLDQLTGVIGSLVNAVWGDTDETVEKKTVKPDPQMKKIEVGDRIFSAAQFTALESDDDGGAILTDGENDAWQWHFGAWCCIVEDVSALESDELADSGWGPFTVRWLPGEE
jgi:hypothetical protein